MAKKSKIRGINAVLIGTQHIDEMIEFYQELGFPLKIADHGDGKHAECDFGELHFSIQPRGGEAVDRSNVMFSLHVPELEAFVEELKDKGIEIDADPMDLPFGGAIAELRDPDGNSICLMRWDTDKRT